MGLLDDAIREHLELKRLRGADPGLVAREEHEAFGPVHGEPADADLDVTTGSDRLAEEDTDESQDTGSQAPQDAIANPEEILPEDGAFAEEHSPSTPQGAHSPDFANVGQETAELDMRTVLDEEPVADVLEETPGPLHDSSEQEPLWFEQRSPQDFDFDK